MNQLGKDFKTPSFYDSKKSDCQSCQYGPCQWIDQANHNRKQCFQCAFIEFRQRIKKTEISFP